MDYRVIWTDRAIRDLGILVREIAKDNPRAAQKFGMKFFASTDRLSSFPRSGRHSKTAKDGREIYEILSQSYRVFYWVGDEDHTVSVLHVRHGARSEPMF